MSVNLLLLLCLAGNTFGPGGKLKTFTDDPYWWSTVAGKEQTLDAYMPSKMPLYRPEQLNEPGACLGCLERVFFFGTAHEPDIYVEVTAQYETKLAACTAHRRQVPQGEESLAWMKELDRKPGEENDPDSLAAKPGLTQTASSQGGRG